MTSDREHVTRADIEKFSRRELAPPDILRVARHLGECADCATRARELVTADDVEDAFGFDEIAHPDVEPELAAYLRSQPAELPRRSPRTAFIATALAAAAAAVFVTIALLNRSPAPAPVPSHPIARRPIAITPAPTTGYGRSDWDDAVGDAVRSHGIAAPSILRDVRESPDVLRGAGAAADAVKVSLSPAGVVIDDTTPRFTWTAFKGAKYVVEVFAGEIPVTSSGPLASNEWMPPKPLKRGKTYTWQVAVRRGETSTIVPCPVSLRASKAVRIPAYAYIPAEMSAIETPTLDGVLSVPVTDRIPTSLCTIRS